MSIQIASGLDRESNDVIHAKNVEDILVYSRNTHLSHMPNTAIISAYVQGLSYHTHYLARQCGLNKTVNDSEEWATHLPIPNIYFWKIRIIKPHDATYRVSVLGNTPFNTRGNPHGNTHENFR